MNKTLIWLEVPAVGGEYEIYVPGFLTVRELTQLLSEAAAELSGHLYVPSGSEMLCARDRNILLDENRTLPDYGIGDGDHLVML